MQHFDRARESPPQIFRSDIARRMRADLLTFFEQPANFRAQREPPSQDLSLEGEVVDALSRLFHAKCAFCETKASIGPHRFRPLGEAEPLVSSTEAHLYYCWLGTDWGNVYSICPTCRRHAGKQFPVRGGRRGTVPEEAEFAAFAEENYGRWMRPHRERPLLLDPCSTRDFARFLSFDRMGGVAGLVAAGRATVEVFGLDRQELVEARAEAFSRFFDMMERERERGVPAPLFDFAGMEFGGAWYLLLRRLVERISERLDQPLEARRNRIRRTLNEVLQTPIGRQAYDAALVEIGAPVRTALARPLSSRRRDTPRRLVTVQVENFKALESLSLDLLPPIPADAAAGRPKGEASALLILGENAAGKSSILEAVALGLIGPARDRLGRPADSFVLKPDLMGAEGKPPPANARVQLTFDDGAKQVLEIGSTFTVESQLESVPAVFAYGAFRQYSDKGRRVRAGGSVATLFHSDHILRNPEAWLLKLDEPKFALVARALRDILSTEADFDVIEPDRDNQRCMIVTRVGKGDDARFVRTPLSVASSGFRSVLAMVCDILEGSLHGRALKSLDDVRPVILVDEIEAHLHPRWKMSIMGALRRTFPAATFLVSTHDPLCLRGMHDREVVVLRRVPKFDAAGQRGLPVFVESLIELPNVENLTIEQLLTSDLFDMFSTDSVEAERRLSDLGGLLALRAAGQLTPEGAAALAQVEAEILAVMPLGSTKVQRLILQAIADYVDRRRGLVGAPLDALERETRNLIADALAGYG